MAEKVKYCRREGAEFPFDEFSRENGVWIHNAGRKHYVTGPLVEKPDVPAVEANVEFDEENEK